LLKPEVPDNIGVKFLKSDPLFSEISAILQAVAEKVRRLFSSSSLPLELVGFFVAHLCLHPNQQIPDDPLGALLLTDPPCSNMTCEYFSLIGTLSSTHEGNPSLSANHTRPD
jgi:hypothetical protein